MKIVRFLGGIGNQMFQYAFYKALQHRFKEVSADLDGFKTYELHNGYEIEKVFGIKVKKAPRFFVKLYDPTYQNFPYRKIRKTFKLQANYYQENPLFGYDDQVYLDKTDKLYWGYWQNSNYFLDVAPELFKDFTFKPKLNPKNQQVLEHIQKSESVAIHVRRGNYLTEPMFAGICDLSYFIHAIQLVTDKVQNPSFFIFSNDIAWCKEELGLKNASFIDWNDASDSYIDMQLMSHCKHTIISNSSFSWWAAFLNKYEGKLIISSKKWINDDQIDTSGLLLENWIKI